MSQAPFNPIVYAYRCKKRRTMASRFAPPATLRWLPGERGAKWDMHRRTLSEQSAMSLDDQGAVTVKFGWGRRSNVNGATRSWSLVQRCVAREAGVPVERAGAPGIKATLQLTCTPC